MSFSNYLLSWLCGGADWNPPSATHDEHGRYIPLRALTSEPPPPLPVRLLPPSLTNWNYRTAQAILTILLKSPLLNHPELTAKITTTLDLPPDAYTPRLAEHVLQAVEATLVADRKRDWGKGFTYAYKCSTCRVSDEIPRLWRMVERARQDGTWAPEAAVEAVRTLLALGVLVTMVPEFLKVLGFTRTGYVKGSFAEGWQIEIHYNSSTNLPGGLAWACLERLGMDWT